MKRKYDKYYISSNLGIACIAAYSLYSLANYGYKDTLPLLIIMIIMEVPIVFSYLKDRKSK